MFIIEGRVEQELIRITSLRSPHEAAGVIINDNEVIELPNHADTPENRFEMHRADMVKALPDEFDVSTLTIWHSHPAGGVGPSRMDLHQRSEGISHLVVTPVEGELVCSWY